MGARSSTSPVRPIPSFNPGPQPAIPCSPSRLRRPVRHGTVAYLTAHAPRALRFFGIKQALFDMAQEAAAGTTDGRATPEGWRPCDDVPGALVRVSPEPKR